MLNPDRVQEIAAEITAAGVAESTVAALRQSHPDMHFTYCMDDDIPNNTPVVSAEKFNLYLIDGREHCLCLTRDYDAATGLVIAEILDDPDE
ncbi:MAG: DUF6129 family protein [Gammaproteobacteria bacterium]